jgi:hypothetical protein
VIPVRAETLGAISGAMDHSSVSAAHHIVNQFNNGNPRGTAASMLSPIA